MADKFRRAKVARHVRIYHQQMRSIAWRHLSGSAVKVLLELATLENGDNNGEFFLSTRKGAEWTGLGKNAVNRALHELQEKGFIYCAEKGGFSRKTPHAACWGLTWQAGPKGSSHRAPSHAYAHWRPEEKCGPRNRGSTVPGSGTVAQNDPPECPQNGDSERAKMAQISHRVAAPKSGTHTSYQSPAIRQPANTQSDLPLSGWWQPDFSGPVAALVYAEFLRQAETEYRLAA